MFEEFDYTIHQEEDFPCKEEIKCDCCKYVDEYDRSDYFRIIFLILCVYLLFSGKFLLFYSYIAYTIMWILFKISGWFYVTF